MNASDDLRNFLADRKFGTILVDPPWQFQNRTGKIAPEHPPRISAAQAFIAVHLPPTCNSRLFATEIPFRKVRIAFLLAAALFMPRVG